MKVGWVRSLLSWGGFSGLDVVMRRANLDIYFTGNDRLSLCANLRKWWRPVRVRV